LKYLKILVFNYEYPPIGGGGGVICKDISEELVNQGHKVTVITSLYGNLKPLEIINGVEVIRVRVINREKKDVASLLSMLSYVPSSIKAANRLLVNNMYDVINTHFAIPTGPAGQFISSKFNIPNILSIHGGDIYDPSKTLSPHKTPLLKQTVKAVMEKADRVVAQSTDTKKNALGFYNLKRDVDIIPLGIKSNQFQKTDRSSLNLPEDKIILSTIGRLVRRKNLPELLEIFSIIRNEIPSRLIVIGNGPEYPGLMDIAKKLELGNDVHFTGRVDEEKKFQYLSATDVYVSTAMHEGFGIVFLEAMECGLPVVCYDKGGQVDFLKDGVTGLLLKLNDKENFKRRLIELLNNKELIHKIGLENKSYVKNFYIDSIANKYLSLFEDVIKAKQIN
jgi:glycosyltransferase involved in cell wall biosynthesis